MTTECIWQRLPTDTSDKAFAAFIIYRDMGGDRTYNKVSEVLGLSPKSHQQIQEWSNRYNWRERAMAYDNYLAQVKVDAEVDAIKEMAERHARIAGKMLAAVETTLDGVTSGDGTIKVARPGSRDLHGWVKTAADLERLTAGQPTEIGKTEVGVTERADPLADAMRDRLQNDPVAQELALRLLEQVAGEVPAPEPEVLPGEADA